MRKIILITGLLAIAALVCGCAMPFTSSNPTPTQTAIIPDQPTSMPTYTPTPTVAPATPTPRASQSVSVSNINIGWTTNKGTESDTVTYTITNDGAQTLTGVTATYEVDTFAALIDPVRGEIDEQIPHVSSTTIGTLAPDQSKQISMALMGGGQNGAYSNEMPANCSLIIKWDGGSKPIFYKSQYQNPDYSSGDMSISSSDVWVTATPQSGIIN